jgi:diguanylate cyclase
MLQHARHNAVPDDEPDVDGMAERAIRFARDSGTALTPEAYHVWFVYASRKNEVINAALDRALNTGARLTRSSIAELFHAHLSGRSLTEELAAYSETLSGTMRDVAGAVASSLEDSTAVGSDLRLIKRNLGLNASRSELLSAVGSLMKANQVQLDATQKLETQLERSKSKIATLEKELAEVRKTSTVDLLTKLPNRRRFDLLLGEAIFNARQRKSPLTLVIADIDQFGPVNERWGHETGDNVLRYFATTLTQNLKGKDTVARFGGEEFAILFTDLTLKDTHFVAEKLRQAFAQVHWTSQATGEEIGSITASFGATELLPGDTRESFVARTERLLLEAKRSGRNQTCSA